MVSLRLVCFALIVVVLYLQTVNADKKRDRVRPSNSKPGPSGVKSAPKIPQINARSKTAPKALGERARGQRVNLPSRTTVTSVAPTTIKVVVQPTRTTKPSTPPTPTTTQTTTTTTITVPAEEGCNPCTGVGDSTCEQDCFACMLSDAGTPCP